MSLQSEVVLTSIAGSTENERLLVVILPGTGLELRQQTWGEGIGWFTQNSVPLYPHQLGELRATLGGSAVSSPRRNSFDTPSHLRIARAESA